MSAAAYQKLDPCPFCDSDNLKIVRFSPRRVFVNCARCEADGPMGRNEGHARELWNQRAPSPNNSPAGADRRE